MFSSLLRPRNRERRAGGRSSPPVAVRRPLLENSDGQVVENEEAEQEVYAEGLNYDEDDDEEEGDEDDVGTPLLPIFASEHLGTFAMCGPASDCVGRGCSSMIQDSHGKMLSKAFILVAAPVL